MGLYHPSIPLRSREHIRQYRNEIATPLNSTTEIETDLHQPIERCGRLENKKGFAHEEDLAGYDNARWPAGRGSRIRSGYAAQSAAACCSVLQRLDRLLSVRL